MKRLLITFYFVFSVLIAPAAFSQESDTVYVYQDEGVSEESLKQTILSFQRLIKKYAVTTINAQKVKEGVWTKNAILFVMPGGADLPYVKKLNGKGKVLLSGVHFE